MNKSLKICTHDDYDVQHLICTDIVFAVASSAFDLHNYYYFSFLDCFYSNWDDDIKVYKSNLDIIRQILDKLGIVLYQKEILAVQELIPEIQKELDADCPVLMYVNYNSLFYSIWYKELSYSRKHCLLVSGYNSDKSTLILQEDEHLLSDFQVKNIKAGKKLYQLQITEDMLEQIWNKTNKGDGSFYLYYIKKENEPIINNYDELITYALNSFKVFNNRLIKFIDICTKGNVKFSMEENIKNFSGSLQIIFATLERIYDISKSNQLLYSYNQFKDNYLKFRKRFMVRLNVEMEKNKTLNENIAENMKQAILSYDSELFNWIKLLKDKVPMKCVKEK